MRAGSGPCRRTTSCGEGPDTYAVASHGVGSSTPESTTWAVNRPWIRRALATSWANRRRNSGSEASSLRTAFNAMGRPPGVWAR